MKIVVWLICILISTPAVAAEYFDWSVRTDRDGKGAGYMATTPFPVDETMTTYSITNDEGTKTFNLGMIYFVDGSAAGCSNGSTNYSPVTRSCDAGSYTVYTSIASGISAVSAGNRTLFVRAGTYNEGNLSIKSGIDDTHRYHIIGYKQERPVVDHGSSGFGFPMTGSYSTLQRIKSQHANESNISAVRSTNNNIVDVYSYWSNDVQSTTSDGSIRAAGSNYLWIYHTTAERNYGHCYKMSDGAKNSLVEWSVAKECGYWPGLTTVLSNTHASGFDYPDTAENHELRYSIVDTVLFNAIQIRGNTGYGPNGVGLVKIHHNEVVSATHFQNVTGEAGHDTPAMVIFNQGYTGKAIPNEIYFYSNIVRDSSDSDARGLRIYAPYDKIYIYNNMFYNNKSYQIEVSSAAGVTPIKIWNNLMYGNTSSALVNVANGSTTELKNNIIYQAGGGSSASVGSAIHAYNIYYAPSGSIGVTLGTGETNANPRITIPSGTYIIGAGAPGVGSPAINTGTNLGSYFTSSFNGFTRPVGSAWFIGAYQYLSDIGSLTPNAPYIINIR